MNARQFFEKVAMMRVYQKAYFRTRSLEDLARSKAIEHEIDAEIARVKKLMIEMSLSREEGGKE